MGINVLMIETVGDCMATCKYCPQGAGLLPKIAPENRLLTADILDKSLSLAKSGNQKIIFLHHRGEPFLHPNLPEIIAKIRKAGFLACLSTNLIVATKKQIEDVLHSGLNQLEVHYSGGRTKVSHDVLLQKLHFLRKANWKIRNNGCRVEVNYALQGDETTESVKQEMSTSNFYDETLAIKFFIPHDWPSLLDNGNLGIDPKTCAWYRTNSCAILCNGDILICCLDQWANSKIENIKNISALSLDLLSNRTICKGCLQQDWFDDWIDNEILTIPDYLQRKLIIDTYKTF